MPHSSGYGKTLVEIADACRQSRPKTILLFIIDGCKADALYSAIDDGTMPSLKSLMNDTGHIRYENCITSFPSVTISTHASVITGAYPGTHGIVGNDWFIRKQWGLFPDSEAVQRKEFYKVTREYVKLSLGLDDPGLANLTGNYFGIANSDAYTAKTIYESLRDATATSTDPAYSAAIFEMISRGAEKKKPIFIDDIKSALRGRILGFITSIRSRFTRKTYLTADDKGLDERAFEELFRDCRKTMHRNLRLFVVWLPGMDGFSHKYGANKQNAYFRKGDRTEQLFLRSMDTQFGRLNAFLNKTCLLDETLTVITADHGQYDCGETKAISNLDIYRRLNSRSDVLQGETLPLAVDGAIDVNCKDASVVVIGNGGACYIYIKSFNGWNLPPERERIEKFLPFFAGIEAVDKVFQRSGDGKTFRLWSNGTELPFETLDPDQYPLAEERVNSLADTLRSGDILLSAKPGYYFADKQMMGEHGSLRADDSRVPLIFISQALKNSGGSVATTVRTIDIAPTIRIATGCDAAPEEGSITDKLKTLLDTLEAASTGGRNPHHSGKRMSTAARTQLDTIIAVEKEDVARNFECKLAHYYQRGDITDADHHRLQKRYATFRAAV